MLGSRWVKCCLHRCHQGSDLRSLWRWNTMQDWQEWAPRRGYEDLREDRAVSDDSRDIINGPGGGNSACRARLLAAYHSPKIKKKQVIGFHNIPITYYHNGWEFSGWSIPCTCHCHTLTNWGWDKIVAISQIHNNPAPVQIMAWRRTGDKPLSEPMTVNLLTHICVTPSQWVNSSRPGDTTEWHRSGSTLTQVMACCPPGLLPDITKPLPEPMLAYHQRVLWHSYESNFPGGTHDFNQKEECKNYTLKFTDASPRGQWLGVPKQTTLFLKIPMIPI